MANDKQSSGREKMNFWQPTADLLAGLVLLLLLIILLLVLYLIQVPDSAIINQWLAGGSTGEEELLGERSVQDNEYTADQEEDGHHEDYAYASGGGGGAGAGIRDNGVYRDGGYAYEENPKSAVQVHLIDGETNIALSVPEVSFRLQNESGKTVALYSYYPEKTRYVRFSTTEDGTFYLPEKIRGGEYTLKQLSEIPGYDLSGETKFELAEEHDWNEAYQVDVLVYPRRSKIRLLMTDSRTGAPVSGGQAAVYAAEDILKADGTIRIGNGELAGVITCGPDGIGESEELYLGAYRLAMQNGGDGCYADADPMEWTLGSGTDEENGTAEIACRKTEFDLKLLDELTGNPLQEGTFLLTGEDGARNETLAVSRRGELSVTELKRGTTYQVTQLTAPKSYRFSSEPISFTVSDSGKIEDSAVYTATVTNRVLRVSLQAVNRFTGSAARGVELTLSDSAGNVITSWVSDESARTFTDLTEGNYSLSEADTLQTKIEFSVRDTAQVQSFAVRLLTMESLIAAAVVLCTGAAMLAVLAALVRFLRQRKKGGQ